MLLDVELLTVWRPSTRNTELQAIDWCALGFSDLICGYQTWQALMGIMG
jgi:hypothetical protein